MSPLWARLCALGALLLAACGGGGEPIPEGPQVHRLAAAIEAGEALAVAADGHTLHVAAGADGWQVYDVTQLDAPRRLALPAEAGTGSGDRAVGVAANGRLAVVQVHPACFGTCVFDPEDRGELRLYDIVQPTAPVRLATLPGASVFLLDGERLYAVRPDIRVGAEGTTFARLDIVDLRDPRSPRALGSLPVPREGALARAGDRLLLSLGAADDAGAGYAAIDVGDPTAPRLAGGQVVGAITGGGAAPALIGNTLALAHRDRQLLLFDLAAGASAAVPRHIDWSEPVAAVAATGFTLYASQGANGLAVIDMTAAAKPTLFQTLSTANPATGVWAFEDFVVVRTERSQDVAGGPTGVTRRLQLVGRRPLRAG